MSPARITVVLATYNRPEVLPFAIRSVLRQTFEAWQLLIIGDRCAASTQAVVDQFQDPRIAYINLPNRCGEQATPNSIGMALANTEYIAFLNHDDIWLCCHLERAVNRLDKGHVDWFIGRSAYARKAIEQADGSLRPVIIETNSPERTLAAAFYKSASYLEPSSSWVFRRCVYDRVGPWLPSVQLYRTALVDWALRAWRQGVTAYFGLAVSTIRVGLHQDQKSEKYRFGASGYAYLERRFESLRGQAVEQLVEEDLLLAKQYGWKPIQLDVVKFPNQTADRRKLAKNLISPATAEVFRETGWDAFAQYCELTNIERGFHGKRILRGRTGEELGVTQSFDTLLTTARRLLGEALC